jgi:hypothetical protein
MRPRGRKDKTMRKEGPDWAREKTRPGERKAPDLAQFFVLQLLLILRSGAPMLVAPILPLVLAEREVPVLALIKESKTQEVACNFHALLNVDRRRVDPSIGAIEVANALETDLEL